MSLPKAHKKPLCYALPYSHESGVKVRGKCGAKERERESDVERSGGSMRFGWSAGAVETWTGAGQIRH
jgi:hypothetical protein